MLLFRICACLVLSFPLSLLLNNSSGYSQPAEEYYPLQEGNVWAYEIKREGGEEDMVAIQELKRIGKKNINGMETLKIVYQDGRYDRVGVDSDGVKLYYQEHDAYDEYETFEPFNFILPFAIESELTKEYEYSYFSHNKQGVIIPDSSGQSRVEVKFEGRENVNVPAGSFSHCLKIVVLNRWEDNNGSFGKDKHTQWFAQGVGKVKEIERKSEYDSESGEMSSGEEEYKLKRAIINGVEYGKED